MSRISWEKYDQLRHRNPMGSEVGHPAELDRHWRATTLMPHHVLMVRVAGFAFEFHSMTQLRECLSFYDRKLHSTSRSSVRGYAVRSGEVCWRREVERWHERLPLYLREEPKRQEVLSALRSAVAEAETGWGTKERWRPPSPRRRR